MMTGLRQIFAGTILLVMTVILLTSNLPERLDLVLYDVLLPLQYQKPADEIVIVAVDEASLRELGRWPWSRRIHAQLLDRLTEVGVKAVGLDILFAEPETAIPDADALLADAMRRNGKVVLVVAPGQGKNGDLIEEILPLPVLAGEAAALGHVDIELDVDGISRRVYLRAGQGNPHWPAFGLALASFADSSVQFKNGKNPSGNAELPGTQEGWIRSDLMLIPFTGPDGSFKQVSFVDVLKGAVPDVDLRDRLILVGSTASGLGDELSTPVSRDRRRMPGVELNAQIVNALLHDREIFPLSLVSQRIMSLGFIAALYLVVFLFPSRLLAVTLGVGSSAVLLASITLLVAFQLWFPPVRLLLILGFSYLLFNWYQMQTAARAISKLEQKIRHQTRYDPVTRLPNREMFQKYMEHQILGTDMSGKLLGVLIVSLDRFREINNSIGIEGGDKILSITAERLRKIVRGNDMVARLRGDEFAVLMVGLTDEKPVGNMGGRLDQVFNQPFDVDGHPYFLSPSIGANLYPGGGGDCRSLLLNTYAAVQKSREDKSKRCWFYDEGIKVEITGKSALENDMHLALQRNEFMIFYQPQVVADGGCIVGVEALLRWNHPELGLVSPAEFVPLAESNGLIVSIGQWVLEQSCKQATSWRVNGVGKVRMAVNLSAVQFNHPDLVDIVANALQASKLPPHLLELELTETALMLDINSATKTLADLKALGVKLAIDDFGTGYSSLSYLKSFPVDKLKIDRSFITEIGSNTETAEITLAIIDMAHRLKLDVIAEGVETAVQQDFLRSNQCDQLQGFLYGRPVPADELAGLLKQDLLPLSPGVITKIKK